MLTLFAIRLHSARINKYARYLVSAADQDEALVHVMAEIGKAHGEWTLSSVRAICTTTDVVMVEN